MGITIHATRLPHDDPDAAADTCAVRNFDPCGGTFLEGRTRAATG